LSKDQGKAEGQKKRLCAKRSSVLQLEEVRQGNGNKEGLQVRESRMGWEDIGEEKLRQSVKESKKTTGRYEKERYSADN